MFKVTLLITDKADRFHIRKLNEFETRYICPKKTVEDKTLLRQLRGLSFNRLQIDAECTLDEIDYIYDSCLPCMQSSRVED